MVLHAGPETLHFSWEEWRCVSVDLGGRPPGYSEVEKASCKQDYIVLPRFLKKKKTNMQTQCVPELVQTQSRKRKQSHAIGRARG